MELRQTIGALETIVKSLAQRQEFYGARLRQFAAQMETTPYPTDPEHLAEVVALQAAGLLGCVESMSNDTQSLVARMRDELAAVTQRLEDAEVTDRLTGLMNRKEMERQIEQRRAAGEEPVLVVFELSGDVRDEVAQAGRRAPGLAVPPQGSGLPLDRIRVHGDVSGQRGNRQDAHRTDRAVDRRPIPSR